MGVVYEAVRDDIGSRAAIKVLRSEFAVNAETAARFFNEARASNLVEHPGIVRIFDYGQLPSGVPYLAMELLIGESLHQRLQRERRLSEPVALRLARQVATVLMAAHAKEVVHRDLKPDNIFIVADAEAEGGERAKILDFGIAKLAPGQQGSVRTHAHALIGTPMYMSPEQCKGAKNITDRVDVYALGLILFEMVAGRPPFVAEQGGEYIGMHLFKQPPGLNTLVPSVSPVLHNAVESMLHKDPQERPTMAAVAALLKKLGNLTSDVVRLRAPPEEELLDQTVQQKRSAKTRISGVQRQVPAHPLDATLTDSEGDTVLLKKPKRQSVSGLLPVSAPPVVQPVRRPSGATATVPAMADADPATLPTGAKPEGRDRRGDWQSIHLVAAQPTITSLGAEVPPGQSPRETLATRLLQRRNIVIFVALLIAALIAVTTLIAGDPVAAPSGILPPAGSPPSNTGVSR